MDFSEEMLDEILTIFQVESEEIISKLNSNLLELEKNPKNKDAILALFRDAHTLKGASRMVGFGNVQNVAHKIEDTLGLAKEEGLILNANVVNVMYKAIDFISELINKSIQNKKEVYSEEIEDILASLDTINKPQSTSEQTNEKQNSEPEFNFELLKTNSNKIDGLIIDSLVNLMKIEIKYKEETTAKILDSITQLYDFFTGAGFYEIKEYLADIKLKLEFTTKGSNNLTSSEISNLQQILDKIINKLISVVEMYNPITVDYYSRAFEQFSNTLSSQKFEPHNVEIVKKEIPTNELLIENTIVENTLEEIENKELNIPVAHKLEDLNSIKDKVTKIAPHNNIAQEVISFLQGYGENCQDVTARAVFKNISSILAYASDNQIQMEVDALNVIKQSLTYCDDKLHNKPTTTDEQLVIQRLEIVQKVMELSIEVPEEKRLPKKPDSISLKDNKFTDFSAFNTGDIKTLRVDSEKLDTLINQVSELSVTKIKTKKHLHELSAIVEDLEDWQKNSTKVINYLRYYDKKFFQNESSDNPIAFFIKQLLNLFYSNNQQVQATTSHISNLYRTIQDDDAKTNIIVDDIDYMVKNIRVLPLATVFHLFGRMVRDIAQEKGKKIELEILGSETCTDKKIIEEIKTPLIHIIRNSIDHGIETPEERLGMGKPESGKISLRARQSNNKVIIEIEDNGRGINIQKIKEKALQKGFLTQEELSSMSNEQLTNLIFAPGFSTGEEITNISGRGIGLDVVQTKISQLNGTVNVISELNKGCCVRIELPTSMSTLKAFLVQVTNQVFAIPMHSIDTVLRKNQEDIISNKGGESILYKEKMLPLYNLCEILKLKKACPKNNKKTILILQNENQKIALVVDKLIGDQEILHKKLSVPLYRIKNISGITTLASGETCLILNISDVLKTISKNLKPALINETSKYITQAGNYKILIVDDSITTRTLEKNILKQAGYNIQTAQNPIEAFEILNQEHFDLIITDVEMPNMNGYEFIEKLKTDEMFSEIPVIMVSSISDEENKKKALAFGAEKYLVKSEFNQDNFLDSVKGILNNHNK